MSYSSFFSSGLLASCHSPPSSPAISRPDSPLILPSTPSRDIPDIEEDATPVGIVHLDKSNANSVVERPRLRKRRSSTTIGTSPIAQIKSSMRSVTSAVQRQNNLTSSMGNRSRSGSVTDYGQARSNGCATESNSLMGRLRSGSVGTMLRSRRVLRKPSAPPPSAPLPPLPVSTVSAPPDMSFETASPFATPRRHPLTTRSSTMDNCDQATPTSSPIPTPYPPNGLFNMHAKPASCEVDDNDNMMKEN